MPVEAIIFSMRGEPTPRAAIPQGPGESVRRFPIWLAKSHRPPGYMQSLKVAQRAARQTRPAYLALVLSTPAIARLHTYVSGRTRSNVGSLYSGRQQKTRQTLDVAGLNERSVARNHS
jgi:hypothetical protein